MSRFIDESLDKTTNVTTVRFTGPVSQRTSRGISGRGTVQVIPHITNEIKVVSTAQITGGKQIAIIEWGGTVW